MASGKLTKITTPAASIPSFLELVNAVFEVVERLAGVTAVNDCCRNVGIVEGAAVGVADGFDLLKSFPLKMLTRLSHVWLLLRWRKLPFWLLLMCTQC